MKVWVMNWVKCMGVRCWVGLGFVSILSSLKNIMCPSHFHCETSWIVWFDDEVSKKPSGFQDRDLKAQFLSEERQARENQMRRQMLAAGKTRAMERGRRGKTPSVASSHNSESSMKDLLKNINSTLDILEKNSEHTQSNFMYKIKWSLKITSANLENSEQSLKTSWT